MSSVEAPATRGSRTQVRVITPEGVALTFALGGVAERAIAFTLDILAILVLMMLIGIAALFATGGEFASWTGALTMLVLFLLRNGWFLWFELRHQGRTPGKRVLGLRVVDRSGGPLTTEAIVARNLTREIEVFAPLVALMAPQSIMGVGHGVSGLVAGAWLFVLALLPLFNRHRLRAGDILAGTMVIQASSASLRRDLTRSKTVSASARDPYAFKPRQLELYGVYELQVLEDVLRRRGNQSTRGDVAKRIQRKIGWDGPTDDARKFLDAFYRAQRARLEQDMLLGDVRERKKSGRLRRRQE